MKGRAMINFVYGYSPKARTDTLIKMIKKDTEAGKRAFLIVPEQFAVASERLVLRELPPSAQLTLEVLNFSRLYNIVCRKYGGLEYNYITKPISYCLMWQNLREHAAQLELYGDAAAAPASFCELVLSAIKEFKGCCVTPKLLEDTAEKLPKNSELSKKLLDLALIYASYSNLVSRAFSDSSDDISKLCDILGEHKFFAGTSVYIDSFTSFTAAEHKAIELIFASADEVTVTVPLATPEENGIYTKSIVESSERLIENASAHGGYKTVYADDMAYTQSATIRYLADNLWTPTNTDKPLDDGAISSYICSSPYTEAEAAARVVLSLLREGYRCRDIVVIARDAEQYRGIIEPAFERADIPFYFSEKIDLSSTPTVKFLLSALRIKLYNWRSADVISHLKTGLYDFDMREIDLFEQYVSTWQIKAKDFTSEFTMNPDGYEENISARGEKILEAANLVRGHLVDILSPFFDALDASETFADKCRALYGLLVSAGVEARLLELAKRESERKNERAASELSRQFSLVCDSLGELAHAMPDDLDTSEMNISELYELLTLFFSKTELGTIPTSADSVTIGSASTLRADNPKCALLLGLCEGVFPASVSDKGILSFAEKQILFDNKIKLSSRSELNSADELMYVHRAIATPTERLYLFSYSSAANGGKATSSLPFIRVEKLFGKKPIKYDSRDLLTLTPTLRSALAYIKDTEGTPLCEALSACAREDESLSAHLNGINIPLSDTECSVSEERASKIFGSEMYLSQSKLDKFVKCHFDYYCERVLSLREEKISRFEANHIGTFVHFLLETLLSRIVTKNGINASLPHAMLEEMTKSTVDLYIERITPKGKPVSARLAHLYRRLHDISLVLLSNIIEEFKHSSFRPEFFELKTDGKGDNPSACEFILKDGTKVILSGIIDRVDIYRRDDGKVYIKVVDYKTGTKHFALEDVKYGLNIQMLLYLFTLVNNKNERFKEKLGGEAVAAGVTYLSSNIPTIDLEEYESEDTIRARAEEGLSRSGLLLDDKDILRAMNEELSPAFLTGCKKRGGGLHDTKGLASEDFFKELERSLHSTLLSIVDEMRSGNADAEPFIYKKESPCKYCGMKPICRHKPSTEEFLLGEEAEEE